MNQNQIQKEPTPLPPETREWLIQYTRQLLMSLLEDELNQIIKEYD